MGKDPKKPSSHQDLKRWDDEGGVPRAGHHVSEAYPQSRQQTPPSLYYFNIRTQRGVIEDPEGSVRTDLRAARETALAKVRDMIAKGDREGEDRRGWRFEIMDRANQCVLMVDFSDERDREKNG
jgi:hypothetical protein